MALNLASKKVSPDTPMSVCHCGGTPVLVERGGVITTEMYKVYKCEKCGQEGDVMWPSEPLCRATWEHTLKGLKERLSSLKSSQ